MRFAAIRLAALGALLVAVSAPSAARADLVWRGQNLSEQRIHKGLGLPTFFLFLDGLHSSFAAQGLSAETPVGTLFAGSYTQFTQLDDLRDDDGDEVDVDYRVTSWTLVERLILFTPLRFGGVTLYLEAIPVFVVSDYSIGGAEETIVGLGDVGIGGGLAIADYRIGDDVEIDGIFALDVFLPTGHYHAGGAKNLSFDVYSYLQQNDLILRFPKIGHGVYFSPALYFSGASESDDFVNPLGGERTDYQFGPSIQAIFKLVFHLDCDRRFGAGAAGFFDVQYRDDRMGGSRIENSKERSNMLGPLVTAVLGPRAFLDLSVMREFEQRNRPQGTRASLIFYLVF
jgi:hypothetical protein